LLKTVLRFEKINDKIAFESEIAILAIEI